jgi:hypothetical protein
MHKSLLSLSLALLLAVAPLYAAPTETQTAGEVKALIPSATRNAQPTKANDVVLWNDLLKTGEQGRLRATLTAGSILSLGSNSELQVVQHDAVSQQTVLAINYGKLRNQVAKVTKPDGKYEVKTPNAVIGVTGTDFYVEYANNETTVICYSGTVQVTPTSGGKVVKKDEKAKHEDSFVILTADQMVVIGLDAPPGGYVATAAPQALVASTLQDTHVPDAGSIAVTHHVLRNTLIGIAAPAGLVGGILGSQSGGGNGGTSTTPPPPPPATTTIDFTNKFDAIIASSTGIATKGSELQVYNGIAAPPKKSLGSVAYSAGAFTGANVLTGGTFASTGSTFVVTSGAANYGQPPKGNIFTGSFTGPVTWTLVSQTGKYTDNFTLTGAFSGTLYTGVTVTGTTTQNIKLSTDQWVHDHEATILTGQSQFVVPDASKSAAFAKALGLAGMKFKLHTARTGFADARLNALARKSARQKGFGWSFVF